MIITAEPIPAPQTEPSLLRDTDADELFDTALMTAELVGYGWRTTSLVDPYGYDPDSV